MKLKDEEEEFIFEERMAICIYDGGLSEDEAYKIAFNEIMERRNKCTVKNVEV